MEKIRIRHDDPKSYSNPHNVLYRQKLNRKYDRWPPRYWDGRRDRAMEWLVYTVALTCAFTVGALVGMELVRRVAM